MDFSIFLFASLALPPALPALSHISSMAPPAPPADAPKSLSPPAKEPPAPAKSAKSHTAELILFPIAENAPLTSSPVICRLCLSHSADDMRLSIPEVSTSTPSFFNHSATFFVPDNMVLKTPKTTLTKELNAFAINSGAFCPTLAINSKIGASLCLRLSQFL